jgi:hypothetical protein
MLWRASRAKSFLYTWKALRERLMRNPAPGTACHSEELDLGLRSDFVVETGPGTTEHHVKELRNIKVNADLDPALFDPHNYVIDGPGN